MRFFKYLTTSMVTGLMLVSCVTINIYFPAAAAEKAADRIIEDIWGPEAQPKQNGDSEQTDIQSYNDSEQRHNIAISVLNWLVAPAAAEEADLNISSPAINTLQQKMKKRHGQLKVFFDSGAIGLTGQGLVAMHNAKAVSLKERNKVKGLVADENKDRQALYAEIARANGHPEWQSDIQATFARRWVDKAAAAWWFQRDGKWKQK